MKVRKMVFLPTDIVKSIFSSRHPYEPPKGDIYIGSGDFIKQGKHQLELLKTYADLCREHQNLDIGSGIGRTAAALTEYLSLAARYEGIDVVEKGITWCQNTIHRDHPNFNFQYVSLHNDLI